MEQAVGLLGGTFDPIHLGHLHIAHNVFKATPIKKIKIIPCYQPVHRDQPVASVLDRVNMVQLAIKDIPALELDTCEILRAKPSFMIETLESLRKASPTTPFCLILGADAYQDITSWKEWQQLLDYSHFLVLSRPNYSLSHTNPWLQKHESKNKNDLSTFLSGKIVFSEILESHISATAIRQRINQGRDILSMVPRSVANYIFEHRLYLETH